MHSYVYVDMLKHTWKRRSETPQARTQRDDIHRYKLKGKHGRGLEQNPLDKRAQDIKMEKHMTRWRAG